MGSSESYDTYRNHYVGSSAAIHVNYSQMHVLQQFQKIIGLSEM